MSNLWIQYSKLFLIVTLCTSGKTCWFVKTCNSWLLMYLNWFWFATELLLNLKLQCFVCFLTFEFVGSAWSFGFFHQRHNGQWPPTSKDFYTRSYPLHYFPILILEKEPVFPFSRLSAKQGNYWYHFYNVFGMSRSLTGDWTRDLPHSLPALYH